MDYPSILIAEDDSDDRLLMQKALEETGSQERIDFVANGVELLKRLNDLLAKETPTYPKFILLDLNMPKMDGCEVLKKIKSHGQFKKIPVIVFSTNKNQQQVEKCYTLGANTYVVKPASFELLVQTVQNILQYWSHTATVLVPPH